MSQWAATTAGDAALYDELRGLFDSDYEPTSGHLLVARLIAERSDRGDGVPSLVVTTNYDDALEQAFDTYGVDHDTLWYIADEPLGGGILWYRDRAGAPSLIERVDDLGPLGMESGRTTLLKIHGTVDRAVAERDSYVITEDHYVDYLARATIEEILPAAVLRRLRRTHILFLGYSLRDWNLRVVLSHLWRERVLGYVSWAVQRDATLLEQTLWDKRGIQLLPVGLRDYLAELIRAISPSTA